MAALGHFELVEKIGEDAAGEVHRAIDTRSGTNAYARILRGAMPARRERFLRETKRAAKLDHEGIARVLGFGQTADGDAFVVVEDPKGERLSARLEPGKPLDQVEAVAIAMQLVRALVGAHDAGVVHRELRPSVVVVEGHGENVRVTITDLALGWSPIAGDPERAYIPPEHRKPGETVGRRADVFSIGAMLHAMLTGKPPSANDDDDVALGPLGKVVRRCLAEDPRDRYLDTIALDAALRGAIAPRVSTLPPPRSVSKPPSDKPAPASASSPASASASASASAPASASASASATASASASASAPPPSSRAPSSMPSPSTRPPSVRPVGRAPAAPPPRPLGRPLTQRPAWEDTLLDFADGPVPRVAIAAVLAFVITRIITGGIVPFAVAVLAGIVGYATWRRSRGPTSP